MCTHITVIDITNCSLCTVMEENPKKKLKLDSSCEELELQDVKSKMSAVTAIKTILSEDYTREIELTRVHVADILDKKMTSVLVKTLTNTCPLSSLQHLKRVKAGRDKSKHLQIVLCSVDDEAFCLDTFCSMAQIPNESIANIRTVEVPKHAPKTRKQYETATQIWPVSFHEDKYISKLVAGTLFSTEDRSEISNYLQAAFTMAKLGKNKGNHSVGCVVVDPSQNVIIAKSHDLSSINKLQTSVMVAIDLVARSQGGGVYENIDSDMYFKDCSEEIKDKTGPYLCTGYDLYMTHEPGVMDAMALVHSRIRRVFYIWQCSEGALGSLYKLHVTQGLNHHYEVFQVCIDKSD